MSALFSPYEPEPVTRPAPFAGRVRPAVPDDAPQVARISVERNGGDPDQVLARTRDDLGGEWNGRRGVVLVAEENDRLLAFGRVREVGAATFEDVAAELRPPEGWYLLGVVVAPAHRRRGIARALTEARLEWVACRAAECYYFVRATNRASIDLHAPFGFEEVSRNFLFPRTGLEAGAGILFRAALARHRP